MTLIKKFSAPLLAVALVASMAVGLLGQQRRAEAAITLVDFTAPVQAAGLTETWVATATYAGVLPAGTVITVAFPLSFTTSNVVAANVTLGGAAFVGVTVASITTGTGTVLVTTATAATTATSIGTITIANVTNPTATTALTGATTATASAGFFVVASAVETVAVADATPPQVWNTVATKSPTTSVAADGASTVAVTFTPNTTALNGATPVFVLTGTTDVGTFAVTPTGNLAAAWTAVTAPVTTVTGSLASVTAATTAVLTVKAPSTAGTSTVILRATPASGGQAVLIGSTSITWTAATTQGAPASASVTSAGNAVTITSSGAGSTLVMTCAFVDASGNAPIPGGTVNITTNLGTLTAPTNGVTAGQSITSASIPVGGVFNVTLNGSGVGGPATVSCSSGAVTANKVISVTGTAATLEVSGRRTNSTTSFSAKGVVRNTDSTTASEGQDELFVVGVAKDSNGNVLAGGNVTFTLTGPAGHTLTWAAAAEQLTLTGATCAGGTNVCIDAIQGGAAGDTTPAHAVAVIDVDTEQPVGIYTVTATIPGDNGATVTGTYTFKLVKAPATLTIGAIPTVGLGSTVSVTTTCKDADGNACPSGTFVTLNVSNANLIAQNPVTGTTGTSISADIRTNDSGVANVNLIGVTSGTTNIVANVGTVTAVASATVGTGPTPSVVIPGVFSGGPIAALGVSIVSFTGTTAALNASGAANTPKIVTVTATVNGQMLTFVVGAPDFVNATFIAAFPNGLIATLVIVKTAA